MDISKMSFEEGADRVKSRLQLAITQNFEQEGDRPNRWKQSLRAKLTGNKTLQASGALRKSIRAYVSSNAISIGVSKTAKTKAGSEIEYAKIHQFGGQAGRNRKVTIPARPFLSITEQDRDYITKIFIGVIQNATLNTNE